MLDTLEEPAGEAEEPAHFDNNVTEVEAGQPQEAPAPDSDNVHIRPAEPALLKALDIIETLQRENSRLEQEKSKLQEENRENYGRASFFQAKLQDAQERILMLEAQPAEEEASEPEAELEKPSGSWWRRLLRRV
jgi:dsDNA-binding SOS-regulon protein